jgi:hypothetical protein
MKGRPYRPGVVTLLGVISLAWSSLTFLGAMFAILAAMLFGAGSWLLGPVAGAVGTVVGGLMVLLILAHSVLAILLFCGGWNTLVGAPSGRELLRLWAWISLVLDGLTLVVTGGLSPTSWWGLIYALAVIVVTDWPEVRAYFEPRDWVARW